MVNQTLNGRYRIESKIGEGGFGSVYRGTELATNKRVALKLLHPEMTKDGNLVARFRREGEVSCNLHDPHTITTFEFDQTPEGTLYIAMELLEGKSLNQVFREQKPLAWQRMFNITLQICSSLGEAHRQGIVHRDLKPDNVYLEARQGNPEFVKVLDFGMAKVVQGEAKDPNAAKLTAMGQTLGTLEYMSPEQLMGAKELDARSDIYALGVLMYEMICGQLPYPEAKQPVQLIMAQLKTAVPPPSSVNPQIPPNAEAVILQCLDKNKDMRFQDVGALSKAIQLALNPQLAHQIAAPHAPPVAPPPQAAPIAPVAPQPLAAIPTAPPIVHAPMAPPAKSNTGMIIAVVAVVVVVIAVVAVLAMR